MNKDILQGKWKQLRGEVQRRWGKLTNDELDEINGSVDKLAGKLQERYGYDKARIEREVDALLHSSTDTGTLGEAEAKSVFGRHETKGHREDVQSE
jgi:uncharacterized protein YjbJ (UPF0337 family)